MTPARSVATRVVALGLAGALAGPAPAFEASALATPALAPPALVTPGLAPGLVKPRLARQGLGTSVSSAPQTCDQPAYYAAQSAAELLRIDRLDLGPGRKPANRKATSSGTAEAGAPSSRELGDGTSGADEAAGAVDDVNQVVGDVGLGDTRTVVIADGPVNSAGAARILNGQVTGSTERNDLALQQAPPVNPKASTRRTGSKKFGPMRVGAGNLSARAVWAHGLACGNAAGDTSVASAGISRLTIAGGGSASLVRVPEKITSHSGTALRLHGGTPQSTSSATITAGRISLVDNEVRLRVLRAPELRVSMTANGQSRVDYQPAVVEVSDTNGKKTRLSTPGDHIEITLSNEMRPVESLPAHLDPIGGPPLPTVSRLPVIGNPEATRVPAGKPGSTLRIVLGDVRHATKNNAVAARATALRVTVTRNVDAGNGQGADGPSGLVADLGIGMLEAAAVAPTGTISGRPDGSGPTGGTPSQDNTASRTGASGRKVISSRDCSAGQSCAPGRNVSSGTALGSADLPITGRRVVPLLIAGAALIVVGAAAVALTSRRRKRS